jgi:hypothetical protein
MSKQKLRVLVFLALVASFCVIPSIPLRAQDVRTTYMPGADFGKYKSYCWASMKDDDHSNQIPDAELRSAVDSQLATKGFIKGDSGKSDLVVTYQKEKQWDAFGGAAFRWIVLDFYDPFAKQLVWQGRATKVLDTEGNQGRDQKNIDKAMKKLLTDFPPRPTVPALFTGR